MSFNRVSKCVAILVHGNNMQGVPGSHVWLYLGLWGVAHEKLFQWVEESISSIGFIILGLFISIPPTLSSPISTDFISVTSACYSPLQCGG